jgi:putative membrane-bound dehydrogenase-like protein
MRVRSSWSIIALAALCSLPIAASFSSLARAAEPSEADSAERDYSAELPRLPHTPAGRALDTFEVEPGFKLELAAAEPLVADPVAIDFDEHGRAYVVEMLGYSEDAEDMLGRIRVLEDADRDGQFDTSTVLTDGLAWPTAVLCYDGGVFVGAAPDLLYFKDADGDGRAEIRRVVFTGFGTHNVQGLLNSFRWGLDNRIHVAVSSCGADLRPGDKPDAKPLTLRGRNFAFDPKTLEVEATSGASQHGFSFDPWGNAFTCSNGDHIQQVVMEDRYLSRNPLMRPPSALKSIGVEGPAADVFRISPVEPWREIRTRLRVTGVVPGMIEGGGRAAGYFTSATGVTIYTGDAWPEEFHGNAFIGDVGSNLVHRKTIERKSDAIPLVAKRATPNHEFIASKDTWFRPVQFANGPDGNLYVLDMYREVIEHPDALPPMIKKHLDLTSGRDRGRIYRVVGEDTGNNERKQQLSRALPGDASTEELVAMLAHPNGWHRTTAARLLFECNDPAAYPELLALFRSDARSSGRLLALHLLSSLDKLDVATFEEALDDKEPRIREHAVRLASHWLADAANKSNPNISKLEQWVLARTTDPDLHVRYQTAFALGDVQDPSRIGALTTIVRRDTDDQYIRAAVLSSLAEGANHSLNQLLRPAGEFFASPAGREFLSELCRQIGARGDERELASTAAAVVGCSESNPDLAGELVVSLVQGGGAKSAIVQKQLAAASNGKINEIITALIDRSLRVAVDEKTSTAARVNALNPLSLAAIDDVGPALVELLSPRHPQEVQTRSLTTLFGLGAQAVPAVLDAWPGMGPQLRSKAAGLMLARRESALELIKAIESGKVSPRDLDPSVAQQMKTHADETVRKLAVKLLDSAAPKREDIVNAHLDVLDLTGDAERGREVFRKNCAICHKKEDFGTEVGADLATVVTRTPEALLINVLDPNREVDPKYLQYTLLTVDGLAKSGMIAAETATSVTLKREQNATETIPRADIETLESTGMTLMPEGFEKAIDKQSLADLIAYLRQP